MTSPFILIKAWNLRPKKMLGQNFLSDPASAEKIVTGAGITKDDVVLEIGAGLGSLTRPLSKHAKKVYAVEKDKSIMTPLKNELLASHADNVASINDSIFNVSIPSISGSENQRLVAIGNIPYSISSQILVHLIQERQYLKKAVLMFQKELAMRIMAGPGTKAYGRLAAMLSYCADVRVLTEIKASQFVPKPKIDSIVLDISFKETPDHPARDEGFLFKVIKASFSKRRKTLKNSLAGPMLRINAKTAAEVILAAGIDPVRRAETLTVAEFVQLSNHLYDNGYR